MANIITILFQMDDSNKYKNIIQDEGYYSSPEYYKAYSNYRKNKGGDMDALGMFVDSIGNSAANALKYGLGLPLDRTLSKLIDNEVKAAVIRTGGTWKD